MPLNKWDSRFLVLAEHISSWSKDNSTKVGAVIVDQKRRILSLGYNGFPRGVNDRQDRLLNRNIKYLYTAHAERNALDNTLMDVTGATLYVTHPPCADCMKGIIQKGIIRVVYPEPDKEFIERWLTHMIATENMAAEAEVELVRGAKAPLSIFQ